MTAGGTVLDDDSLLSRLERAFLRLEKAMGIVAGIGVICLMLFAVVSVGGRNFFNFPLPGYVDWIEQIMPLIAFLGISYVQRDGGHIRMDIVIRLLNGRVLWAAELLAVLLILALVLALGWGSYAHFERSFDFTAPLWSRDNSMDIGVPIWPSKLLAPVAFLVLAVRLCLQAWGYGRAFINNEQAPVCVPLPINTAMQAARESEALLTKEPPR